MLKAISDLVYVPNCFSYNVEEKTVSKCIYMIRRKAIASVLTLMYKGTHR
jgi:hypothetical protein